MRRFSSGGPLFATTPRADAEPASAPVVMTRDEIAALRSDDDFTRDMDRYFAENSAHIEGVTAGLQAIARAQIESPTTSSKEHDMLTPLICERDPRVNADDQRDLERELLGRLIGPMLRDEITARLAARAAELAAQKDRVIGIARERAREIARAAAEAARLEAEQAAARAAELEGALEPEPAPETNETPAPVGASDDGAAA